MKGPVRYSRGQVKYTGRIDRAAFIAWCDSSDGRSVLDPLVAKIRFSFLGKARAARRRLFRELTAAARSATVVAAVQREIDSYLTRLDTLAYARDLPCAGVDLHRLVVVPRLFANSITQRRLDAVLEAEPGLARHHGHQLLRDWFTLTLVDGIAAAVMHGRPSPKRPLTGGDAWTIVGVNGQFDWRLQLTGPAWPGHFYLLERTHRPMTRAVRKATGDAIAQMEISLPSLSRSERNEILRQAGLSIEQLLARRPATVAFSRSAPA
jgi:hypothetical protein